MLCLVGLWQRIRFGYVVASLGGLQMCGQGCYSGLTAHRGGAIEHMRRLATRTQRDLLAILQDFRCSICGCELPARFECDHLVPFSEGGPTTLRNLQALCPPCHSDKTRAKASGMSSSLRLI